jgi:excisionase family DNA binding protein
MKLAYTINEACEAIGVGRTTIYEEIALGNLLACKVHKRTIIRADDLERFLRSLPKLGAHVTPDGEE